MSARLEAALRGISASLALLRVTRPDGESFATGYLVSSTGHVLTCAHAVAGASEVVAQLTHSPGASATPLAANVLAADATNDLALLHLPGARHTAPVTLWSGDYLPLGREVAFLGFPHADLFQPPLVMTVRAIVGNRYTIHGVEHYVLDAMASEGFSGGPVLQATGGAVVATLSARFDPARTRARRAGDAASAATERTNLSFAVCGPPALDLLRAQGVRPVTASRGS